MTLDSARPRIVVTLAVAEGQSDPELAARKNTLYTDAVGRHGGDPIALDAGSTAEARRAAFAAMDGLLLSGGADLHPSRYGQPMDGSVDIEPDRDDLEAEAWSVAVTSVVPVLGLCRGLQAINVFSGGSLLQDVPGHVGHAWGRGPATTHPIRLVPASRLARIIEEDDPLEVNSYHHQGIRPADLAPGLLASAWSDSAAGPLIEGLEATDDRFIVGVQCHPERRESTPAAFERLFAAFVAAASASRPSQAPRPT